MAIVTHKFRTSAASGFASTFNTDNIYLILGRPQSWDNNLSTTFSSQTARATSDTALPAPVDNTLNEFAMWRDALAAVKLGPANVKLVTAKNVWNYGTRYDMYRHNVSSASPTETAQFSLSESNFIVFVTSTGCVYKCLYNGKNADTTTGLVSTIMPTTTGLAPEITADGYVWKYLYTITAADSDFITANYIPVKDSYSSVSSICGIDVVLVENAGSGYTGTPTVSIYGDGTGAAATAVANTSTGKITNIDVTNAGSGYTWAKIVLTGGGTPTTANAIAIIAPPGGHGSDLINETHAHNVMIAGTVTGYDQTDFPVNQDFRTIALVKNPSQYSTSVGWRVTSNTLALFTSSTGRILRTLYMTSGATVAPAVDAEIAGSNSLATGIFVFQSSGTVRLEYIQPVNADNPEIINNARIDTTGTKRLYEFSSSDTITASGYSELINATSGLTEIIPEIHPYSGDLMYLDYRQPVSRAAGQNEKINIVINF